MIPLFIYVRRFFYLLVCITLIACGGGGNPPSPPPPPAPDDITPNTFSFAEIYDAEISALILSSVITIDGINASTLISIEGGEYSVDGGEFTSEEGVVSNSQDVQIRLMSSQEEGTEQIAVLTVGGVSATFSVRTGRSILVSVRSESEDATLIGNSLVENDASASSGMVVGNILDSNSGISASVPQNTVSLDLSYASEESVPVSVTFNGGSSINVVLQSTGGLSNYMIHPIRYELDEGDTVEILRSTDGGSVRLDYIEFIPTPYQKVDTFAPAYIQGDGLSVDNSGNVYVSSGPIGGRILKIAPDLTSTVFATGMTSVNGSDLDSVGNLFVAAYQDNAVYKITPEGERSTFAGSLNGPAGVWVDSDDNVYVSEFGAGFSGTGARVLRFTAEGVRSVYAEGGGLLDVIGITGNDEGEVFVGNWASGRLYNITDGNVSLLLDTSTRLNMIDYADGYIYIPDHPRNRIVRINIERGEEEEFAGFENAGGVYDGHILDAGFAGPAALAFSVDKTEIYVLDNGSGQIRIIHQGLE